MTSVSTPSTTAHGYPRQGPDRELKRALERHWRGDLTVDQLLEQADAVRRARWRTMETAGLDEIPVGDFSLYDHVLDASCLFGAVPPRFTGLDDPVARYFAMARGTADVPPLEMTKWFDTNYHYLVPELGPEQRFTLHAESLLAEVRAARETLSTPVRPVVVGPITFLRLAKPAADAPADFDPLSLLDRLLPAYGHLLGELRAAGVDWLQLDEPILVTDLTVDELAAVERAYRELTGPDTTTARPNLLLASYFGHLGAAAAMVADLPVEGLAIDLTGPGHENLDLLAGHQGLRDKRIVAGVVDGRNVWRADLDRAAATVFRLAELADRVDVAPSCSLLHVPLDVTREDHLDDRTRGWLAFADQKLAELGTIATAAGPDPTLAEPALTASRAARATRPQPVEEHRTDTDDVLRRRRPYADRTAAQQERLGLPRLPTTTIGSFPQTDELRRARAALRRGTLDPASYDAAIRTEIDRVITLQEELGLDVLVHGEPERNDMVQYFAEQLDGIITTRHGWVQSYGSRYVRPPIIAGEVVRPAPMTVGWTQYAQSRTDKPVKGMLTGPITMLAWSFVRDDQPWATTARQLARALRAEVLDLEAVGTAVIQVDEPALRETLPLRRADRPAYLRWAVDAFRLTTAGVRDDTQIHTHMCYAEFGDITEAIIELDADVISLEATRSHLETVSELAAIGYASGVGPGVWDIHSPRVPTTDEIARALRSAVDQLDESQLWVNPDCGLKTRRYPEVAASLANLVAAAELVRTSR
ncbi:5-methyltetrahydropteroyltriglutamate--homocysteine S-methyltransferase [Microlunatus sp. Y2014]|uniref:5-methyltetrahydropteroyltriglutamate-- homocysteine S-methyltransferase n=1 Tax=Microlunatus sp. Y2014 TaxID=3418488 RepID=UPI003DA772E7